MKFLLGTKQEMRTMYSVKGDQVPVTVIASGVVTVTQVRTTALDGYQAVQLGFAEKKKRLSKAQAGHLKGLPASRYTKEVRLDSAEKTDFRRGDQFDVSSFGVGDMVTVQGVSKGHGFQGVVKRHGFAGHPSTHGHKDQLRMPGSLSAGGLQHVQKGRRMGGRMGSDKVTVANLEIMAVDAEHGQLIVKGAVPGARGTLLVITADEGTMQVRKPATATVEAKELTPVT